MKLVHILFIIAVCMGMTNRPATAAWSVLGVGPGCSVEAVAVDTLRGLIYVGGADDTGYCKVMKWDGLNWEQLGVLDSAGTVKSLAFYHDTLHVCGNLASIGHVGSWNGTSWNNIGGFSQSDVHNLMPFDTLLVAANFTRLEPEVLVGVVAWNGHQWHELGKTMMGGASSTALLVHDSCLYVGCEYYIQKWNGEQWTEVAVGTGISTSIRSMAFFNYELYAGGIQSLMGNGIRKWTGSDWVTVGSLTSGPVNALLSWRGVLYVAGAFTAIGSYNVRHLAIWNGETWTEAHGGLNGTAHCLTTIDTTLFIGGKFSASDLQAVLPFCGIWSGSDAGVMPGSRLQRMAFPTISYQPNVLTKGRDRLLQGAEVYTIRGCRVGTPGQLSGGMYIVRKVSERGVVRR